MKRRTDPFETKLARVGEIKRTAPQSASAELRALLGEKEHYLTAQAAEAIAELGLSEATADLAAAFARLVGGEQPDKGCVASLAVVRALSRLEADVPDVYLAGLRLVRREPSGPGFVDRAAPIRVECALALVRTGFRHAIVEITPLLVDPEPEVRAGAAQAIGATGGEAASAVLHLKLLSSDSDPEVLGACMTGLLHSDPARFLPKITRYLGTSSSDDDDEDGGDDRLAEVAALALGDSRAAGAFAALKRALEHRRPDRIAATMLLAIALLRDDAATAYLLGVLETGKEPMAIHALSALAVHKHVASVNERVRAIVAARGLPRLAAALVEKFGR